MKFSVAEMMAVSEEAKKVAEEGEAVVLGDASEGQELILVIKREASLLSAQVNSNMYFSSLV